MGWIFRDEEAERRQEERRMRKEREEAWLANLKSMGWDEDLLHKLRAEQESILRTCHELQRAATSETASAEDFVGIRKALKKLNDMAQAHGINKNTKLYTFLRNKYAGDDETRQKFEKWKTEADQERIAIRRFANEYKEIHESDARRYMFSKFLEDSYKMLKARHEFEQKTLFVLY